MSQRNLLRQKGQEYMEKGYALIDCSYRTRHEGEKSAIALAAIRPNLRYAILAESAQKKEVCRALRKKYPESHVYTIVHAIQIYCLLDKYIDSLPGVFICADGFNSGLLKHYLKLFLHGKYNDAKIQIHSSLRRMFGKKNIADSYAYEVAAKKKNPDLKLDISVVKRLRIL